MLPVVSFTGA